MQGTNDRNGADATKVWFTPTRGASNWLWLSVFVILLDQATKVLVAGTVQLYDRIVLLPFLDITHLQNRGAAFSILHDAGGWQRWFFIALALGVSVMLMIWLRRIRTPEQTVLALGLSLVLGGALGNVIDRVWFGYVVDFIHFHWNGRYFPAFNVADSAITIGAVCLLIDAFREGGKKPQQNQS
ncbi:MAG: signal peptidase II [Proteobacteria bacterium]|nr:MAG: signal peptidase II [Pseudomonadota bacterium]